MGKNDLVLDRVDLILGWRIRAGLRKIDIDRMGRHRDGDDEHDEKNEQHVDQRRHVHRDHRGAIVLSA